MKQALDEKPKVFATENHSIKPKTKKPLLVKLRNRSGFIQDSLNSLYEIGFEVEYLFVRFHRTFAVMLFLVAQGFKGAVYFVFSLVKKTVFNIINEFFAPFRELKRAKNNINKIKQEEGHYGKKHVNTRVFYYVSDGIRKHLHLTKNPFYYAMPLVAFAIFTYTVYTILSYNFLLQVSYKDETIGIIPNETVFESAQQLVKSRIVYEGTEEKWDIKPEYNIVMTTDVAQEEDTSLADTIISKSGKDIANGTGFYIDNEFMGATLDKIKLEDDLEKVLEPYQSDDPNIKVTFARDIKMIDGLFLASSVVDNEYIKRVLTSSEGETTEYVVLAKESINDIAAKNGVTAKELVDNNPFLATNEPFVGQKLVITTKQSFLPVKTIETTYYEEAIPFQTVKKSSDKFPTGTRKVDITGKNGLKKVTAEVVRIDGVLIETNIIANEVLEKEINEEIIYGTAIAISENLGPALGSGVMQWPTGPGTSVSRPFSGVYAHNGIDIRGPYGTPLLAADSGVVTKVVYSGVGYGVWLMINHGNGVETLYGHASAIHVVVGQPVAKGQVVASMGSTGNSTGNHIHFEVIINGTRVDPGPYIY